MGFDPSKVREMSDEELLHSLGGWDIGTPQYVVWKIEYDLTNFFSSSLAVLLALSARLWALGW